MCTTAVVKSDAKALSHYGLTMALLIEHDPHELTTTMVTLTLPLSDFDIVL